MNNDLHLPLYGYVFGVIKLNLVHAVIGMPNEAWWIPMLVMSILCAAALVDAFSSTVPDWLIFVGLLAVVGGHALYVSWPYAMWHLGAAIVAFFAVWAANELWRHFFKVDAIGMGDAKWSALAVACFDVVPVVIAWGAGAWIALIWMGALRVAKYETTRVYFTPFLFLGLLVGIWWVRLRGLV